MSGLAFVGRIVRVIQAGGLLVGGFVGGLGVIAT
jgi:hypothetical protein